MNTIPNSFDREITGAYLSKINGQIPGWESDTEFIKEALNWGELQLIWALNEKQEVVGYAAYRPDARRLPSFRGRKNGKPKFYLSYIAVDLESRKQGAGSALLKRMMELAQGRLYLHCDGNAWYENFATKEDLFFKSKQCGLYRDGSPKVEIKLKARTASASPEPS